MMVTRVGPHTIALPVGAIWVTLECEKGHQERGSMAVSLDTQTGEYQCTGGSAWDHCSVCGAECDIGEKDDCYKDGCNHGWRSDESRAAGHILVSGSVEAWCIENSHLIAEAICPE